MDLLMRYAKLLLLCLIPLVITFHTPPESAHACSGPGESFSVTVQNTAHVVRATVLEVDRSGHTHTLQVHEYLTGGSGPEYVVYRARSQRQYDGRRFSLGCWHPARAGVGTTGYFFLREREETGVFVGDEHLFFANSDTAAFIEWGFTEFSNGERVDWWRNVHMDEVALRRHLYVLTGDLPQQPYAADYPLKGTLRLTTAYGSEYMLPVDNSTPIFLSPFDDMRHSRIGTTCRTAGCVAVSHLGYHTARLYSDGTLQLTETVGNARIEGTAIAFSDNGQSFAIWRDDVLYVRFEFAPSVYLGSGIPSPPLEHNIALDYADHRDALNGAGVWGHQQAILAYSDANGLWLVNASDENAAPRLLIAAEERLIEPMGFSYGNQHLYLTIDGQPFTYSILFDQLEDYQIYSPDEQYAFTADWAASRRATWTADNRIIRMTFNLEGFDGDAWNVYDAVEVCSRLTASWCSPALFSAIDYDYDMQYDRLVVLEENNFIYCDGRYYAIDLDVPIVKVEWLDDIFFEPEIRPHARY